jgi:hypothetical protein
MVESITGEEKKPRALTPKTGCVSFGRPWAVVKIQNWDTVEFCAWTEEKRKIPTRKNCDVDVLELSDCESEDSGLSALGRAPYNAWDQPTSLQMYER